MIFRNQVTDFDKHDNISHLIAQLRRVSKYLIALVKKRIIFTGQIQGRNSVFSVY